MCRGTKPGYRFCPVQVGLVRWVSWRGRQKDVRRQHDSELGLSLVGDIEDFIRARCRRVQEVTYQFETLRESVDDNLNEGFPVNFTRGTPWSDHDRLDLGLHSRQVFLGYVSQAMVPPFLTSSNGDQ